MEIYICDVVDQVQQALRDVPISKFETTAEMIDAHAEVLLREFQSKSMVAKFHISNWHLDWVGKSAEEIFAANFSLEDCRQTLSREFGFLNWDDVLARSEKIDHEFERCVDSVLKGDLDGVRGMLEQNPGLAKQTSSFGHRATLLLYLGSNGVETWRQYVPMNAPEMARLLIDSGADPLATMNVYGGQFDCVAMVESSAHPREAGIVKELVAALQANSN